MAKWEKAFTSDGGVAVLIEPDEFGHDFIDIDPDRFFVLVKDSTAGATLNVTIETTHPTAAAEYKDNATTITLTKLANLVGWGNWYLSDSQMLVSNQKDDDHTELPKRNKVSFLDPQPFAGGIGDDNVAPNGGLNHKYLGGRFYDFAVSDRTHIVALGGSVKVVYGQNPAVEVPVKVKGVVKVHMNNMRSVAGGDPAVVEAVWKEDLKKTREIYAQVGLDVRFTTNSILHPTDPDTYRTPPASAEVFDPPAGAGLDEPQVDPTLAVGGTPTDPQDNKGYVAFTAEEKALFGDDRLRTITDQGKKDVEVYYVIKLTAKAHGVSYPQGTPPVKDGR